MLINILLNILGPIMLMIALGAILRWKFHVDLTSLSKLNIFLFVPAFVFHNVSTSTLRPAAMAAVVGVTALQSLLLGAIVWTGGRLLGAGHKTLSALMLAVMFYNSGNFGLPLVELAYRDRPAWNAAATQAFVLMTQNVLTFTLGMMIAAWGGGGSIGRGLMRLVRLPILPALAAALFTRWCFDGRPEDIPRPIAETARYLSAGLVPLALVTLGAQLASNPRWPKWKPMSAVLLLRLVYAPVQMACILWIGSQIGNAAGMSGLNLYPQPARMLILTAAVPSAINTLLLTMELEGDAQLAADCVFWTTVASIITVSACLAIVGT